MPLSTRVVGTRSGPFQCQIDNRWAMNFAASVEDGSTVLYDTRQGPIPVHPIFLAYPEWESQKLMRERLGLNEGELSRAVQVTHDTRLFRPLKAGMALKTEATVIGVHRHRAGAWSTVQHDHTTPDGEPVARTTVGAIYRGVAVEGDDRPAPAFAPEPGPDAGGQMQVERIELSPTACHVYSECARIWNPIHTDLAVAAAAGLPGLILHATATIAKAASAITGRLCAGNPEGVTRVAGRFQAMVIVPTSLKLEFRVHAAPGARRVSFDVWTPAGDRAITGGLMEFKADAAGG